MIPVLFLGTVLFWLAFPLLTAAPGIVGGDAPELTAAAFHLGSAHAPGYPLYLLLGRLFQLLPLGTPAFRMTFFSILAQASAYAVLVLTFRKLVKDSWPSVERVGLSLFSAFFIFSGSLIFHQEVSPEVFALHLIFTALLLYLVLFPTPAHFLTGSIVVGAALSHQHLTLLILPAFLWAYRSYFKNAHRLVMFLTLFLIGLTPYLELPLRAAQSPLINWGNPVNIHQFLYQVTRTQYGGDITSGSLQNGFWDFVLYLRTLAWQGFGFGLFLAGMGLWKNRSGLKTEYFIGAFFLLVVLPFLIRAPHDPENNFINKAFLPPAILWFSPLVLRGAEWIYEQTSRAKRLLLIGAMLLLAANLAFSYTQNNASQNTAIENVGCDILQQMPSHSVLYSEGDSVTFPLAYFKLVLNLRPDVEVFDRTGGLFKDLYHLLDYRKNPEVSPDKLVAIERSYEREHLPTAVFYSESAESPSRALTMTGLLFQAIDKTALVFPDDQLWNHFRTPKVRISNDYLSRETAARFYLFKTTYDLDFSKNTSLALEDIRQAKTLAFDNSRLLVNAGVVENAHDLTDQAGLTFERATDVNPDFYLAWYDRGVTSDKQHQNKDAIRYLQKAIQLAPDSLEGHQRLAFQYYQAKRYSDAVKEWETARKLNPLSPDNYRNLGFIFMQSQPEYAAQLFCQYLALAPQSPDRPVIEKFLSNVGP